MTALSSETLITAAERLITEIGTHAGNKEALDLQKLEHCARALTAQLKAIQDLDAHNKRQTQHKIGQTYTRYEDLPPPSPAEQDRFYARLKSAIHRIENGPEI